ncbi:MAG: class D beta-lactamase [Proteiniphilum sp.]|uniref:class D beta-lactamase n=1 Tax=Proteiniphilum sp. TaxID=1926877 RepID=UPI002B2009FE|nr:class D beta-lactamase [Proteiniphilum sp.]MEA5127064.1 class D beta-lactamase [Proteiniphilum sp.]
MKIGLISTIIVLTINCFAGQPTEISELKKIFEKYKVDGSILIYDQKENTYIGYDLKRCNIAFCPASTFKIPNTLIALESGIYTIDSVFKWNGEKRTFSSWEKDMTIEEAFRISAVPVYQEIARHVGVEKMKYYTQLFNYGNLDINGENIDKFWLEGKSSITQYQQIYFLQKLYNLQLPISENTMKRTKEIMLYEAKDNYRLSGKTGWAVRQKENVTWFVGFIETNSNAYFFATNVASNENTDLKSFSNIRIELTKEIFKELKIITEE